MTAELRQRGFEVNHKRVLRLMREDNLLCLRRRSFVITTDSSHHLRAYPNLAREMRPDAINQLWIADITYIRLRAEFVYLAVVLDAFSRRVIGWALGRTLEAKLAIAALRMAIDQRKPAAGLVHHSDRGVQYASTGYTGLLQQHKAEIGMSKGTRMTMPPASRSLENPQVRRGVSNRISRSAGGAGLDWRVHRTGLQPNTTALGAWLCATGRV